MNQKVKALCGALADLAQHVDEATDRELADALDGTLLDHVSVDVRPLLVSVIERLRSTEQLRRDIAMVPHPPPICLSRIRKMDKKKADMNFVREDARALLIGAWPQRVILDDAGRLAEITIAVDRLEGDPQAANVVEVVLDRVPDITLTAGNVDPEGWEALSDWATAWLEREINP